MNNQHDSVCVNCGSLSLSHPTSAVCQKCEDTMDEWLMDEEQRGLEYDPLPEVYEPTINPWDDMGEDYR